MRIAHANKAYWPHLGGVETVVRDLAEGAAARGHEVAVLTAGRPGLERRGGVELRRSRSFGTVRSLPVAPGLVAQVLRASADVLHVHEPSILPEAVLAAAPGRVRRRVGCTALSWHSDLVRQRVLGRVAGPVLDRALACADVVLAATPHHVATSPALGRCADKVRVVPFGVDPQRYAATGTVAEAAAQERAGGAGPLVLFLGRLVYYKGVPQLLEAAEALPDARFQLVGSGPLEAEVRASAAHRRGQLDLRPPVDERTKVALLHAADVLVLPSTAVSEAYGIVLVEAMACGTPVVTYDLPTGVTWLNRHGETGLVARRDEPGSLAAALGRILSDDALRASLGAAGRRRVEDELTLDLQVEGTLAAYEDVLAGRT